MNPHTNQWHGLAGFEARMIAKDSSKTGSRINQKRDRNAVGRLDVKTVNVDEWVGMDEGGKMNLLSDMLG